MCEDLKYKSPIEDITNSNSDTSDDETDEQFEEETDDTADTTEDSPVLDDDEDLDVSEPSSLDYEQDNHHCAETNDELQLLLHDIRQQLAVLQDFCDKSTENQDKLASDLDTMENILFRLNETAELVNASETSLTTICDKYMQCYHEKDALAWDFKLLFKDAPAQLDNHMKDVMENIHKNIEAYIKKAVTPYMTPKSDAYKTLFKYIRLLAFSQFMTLLLLVFLLSKGI